MKIIKIFTAAIASLMMFSSCNYLDHNFNDQMTLEEVFSKRPTTERFLAGVYSVIPDGMWIFSGSFIPCADDAYFSWEKMDYELVRSGNYNESTVGVAGAWTPQFNPWAKYYIAINQASVFISHVDECLELTPQERSEMKAEARVLRAYYYFLLFQQYGPIYIWGDKEADLGIMGDNVDRNTVDECVDFMTSQLEMAANDLPVKVADPTTWQGRITKGFALGLRSRIFLYAARPLFNGGGEIQYGRSLVNKYGEHIFPQSEDPHKWDLAAEAAKQVIDMGIYDLHKTSKEFADPVEKGMNSYREVFVENGTRNLFSPDTMAQLKSGTRELFLRECSESD